MTVSEGFARRYRLLERIAIGGTAEVFRAQLTTDDGGKRPVVIKRVLPQFARDERFRKLFLEEACLTATLTHPSIVRVLDHGEIDNTCYITLELVDGKNLGSLLAQARDSGGSITPGAAVLVAIRVAEALQFIHDRTSSEGLWLRIIHRDVSPQNILVSYQGDVKLTDFGIAKSAIRQEHTVDGTLRGKLDYMSPEQAMSKDVDHRADIFGLGCVLYEMLAGAPPFRAETEIETLDRLRHGQLALPADQLDLPAPLRAVLARALEPDRDARYQQAGELAADLRAYLDADGAAEPDLARWVAEVTQLPTRQAPTNAVDDAVKQLLGETASSDDWGPPAAGKEAPPPATGETTSAAAALSSPGWGTSVFVDAPADRDRARQRHAPAAPAGRGLQPARTAEIVAPAPPAPDRARWLAVPLVALGVLGWVLWMVDRSGDSPPSGAGAVDAAAVTPGPDDASAVAAIPAEAAATPTAIDSGQKSAPRRVQPRPKKSGRRRAHGYLTINSMPWSKVYLDGRFVGNTPLVRMQVSAGQLRVQLRGPSGRLRRAFLATVRAGLTRSYAFDLTKTR